jgi:hypothetical protein
LHPKTGDVSFSLVLDSKLDGASDDTLLNYFSEIKKVVVNSVQQSINVEINGIIKDYYNNLPYVNSFVVTTTLPNYNYSLLISQNEDPTYVKGQGIFYSFTTNGKRIVPTMRFLSEKKAKYGFDPVFGDNQVYIKFSALNTIFSDFDSVEEKEFYLNNATNLDGYYFRLTVESLGNIIPSVYLNFTRDAKVRLSGTLENFVLTGNQLDVDVNFIVVADKDGRLLFDWLTKFSFQIEEEVDKVNRTLNFRVADFKIVDSFLDSHFGQVNYPVLKNWIEESLNYYKSQGGLRLFSTPIDLSNQLPSITTILSSNEGVLLGGN